MCMHQTTDSKHIKKKLTELKVEIDKPTLVDTNVNIFLSDIDKINKQIQQ